MDKSTALRSAKINSKISLCGKPMPKAKNGADRGFCTRFYPHTSSHGNNTCCRCGVQINAKNSSPGVAKHRSGWCRICTRDYQRNVVGKKPMNWQKPQSSHTFPCGCSGILPKRGSSNKFAIYANSASVFACRLNRILFSSQDTARNGKYKPIPKSTPHSVIRKMMDNPNCVRCHRPLSWDVLGLGKTPHLHHNHNTGEIYGFTHVECNPQALEQEINRLKNYIRQKMGGGGHDAIRIAA
ncbi:MAG: hypothetical protein WAN14_20415 [Candidatus Acidiferrales bacterium]